MWWLRSFSIQIVKNGEQYPSIHISPEKYDVIKYVFRRKYCHLEAVNELIQKIKCLTNDSIKLEAEDKCELIINRDITYISGFFDEFEPFEVPTSEILTLVEEWYEFLKDYEEGKIPGIIPKNKEGELFIVPKEYIKEEFWQDGKSVL